MNMTPGAQDSTESGAEKRVARKATAARRRRQRQGFYYLPEVAMFLAKRHAEIPSQTAEHYSGYMDDLVHKIESGKLTLIDARRWKARTVWHKPLADAGFLYSHVLVLATEINALEAAQGSTLPPLPTGIVDLHISRDDEPAATVSERESMDTDQPREDRNGSSAKPIRKVKPPRVYWRIVLFANITTIDQVHRGKANVIEVMAWLRDPKRNDERILRPPYSDGVSLAATDGIVWIDDAECEQIALKKTISSALSDARSAARLPV